MQKGKSPLKEEREKASVNVTGWPESMIWQCVQGLFKEMVSTVLENGFEVELEGEPGYSKYDYRNKQTDNSRNGYSEKTMKTSLGDMIVS